MTRAKTGTRPAQERRPLPRLRRAYHDCRFGQLHLHNAIPAGGGFDELTPLLCVHGSGHTGRVFRPVLAALGSDRSIYAPDLPGCGETDPAPPTIDAVEAGAAALADFLESMRIRSVDLLSFGDGAAVLRRFVAQQPKLVRRLVLVGEPRPAPLPPGIAGQQLPEGVPQLEAQLAAFLS